MRKNTWTVELIEQGEFKSTDAEVQRNMKECKAYLASAIVDCYGGDCGEASTKAYWMGMPKMTLAVVLAGLQYPLN